MGTFEYVTPQHIAEIDDRTLAHLQIVICNKLRRNERFILRLSPEDGVSGPLTVLWMEASLPLRFTYTLPTRHSINPVWLQLLADAAAGSAGLWIVPEPAQETSATQHPVRRETIRA